MGLTKEIKALKSISMETQLLLVSWDKALKRATLSQRWRCRSNSLFCSMKQVRLEKE